MAGRRRGVFVLLFGAVLACGAAADKSGPVQNQRGEDARGDAILDARLLAELEILRDLELLRDLDRFRKAEEVRGVFRPHAPQEEKGTP